MTSSVEIFDAEKMEHVGTHSFGIQYGSLTWVDWHDGPWWMTFANYDRLIGPGKTPYGHKANSLMVKFTKDFRPVESWTLPKSILDRFEDMSNSGGSWGPDGYLYLSGHDPAEIYRMRLPKAGSVLELVDVIPMNIRGQGIAWDRSQPGAIIPGRYRDTVIRLKRMHTVSTNTLAQTAVADFLSNGRFELHLRHLRKALHTQSLRYIQAVCEHFP